MKKGFKDVQNPAALQFISTAPAAEEQPSAAATAAQPEETAHAAEKTTTAAGKRPQGKAAKQQAATKPNQGEEQPSAAAEEQRAAEAKSEPRSRRYNCSLAPAVAEALEKIAFVQNSSVSELMNKAAAEYIDHEESKRDIETYNASASMIENRRKK